MVWRNENGLGVFDGRVESTVRMRCGGLRDTQKREAKGTHKMLVLLFAAEPCGGFGRISSKGILWRVVENFSTMCVLNL